MAPEIAKIIVEFISHSEDYQNQGIYKAIEHIAEKYPSLTEIEKEEIKTVAESYRLMALVDYEEDEEVDEDEIEVDEDEIEVEEDERQSSKFSDMYQEESKGGIIENFFGRKR